MKRKSNWLKNLLQWGTLAAIVGFVVYGLTLGEKPADVEAYCPFGGLQALVSQDDAGGAQHASHQYKEA